jgi:hypothetical protein
MYYRDYSVSKFAKGGEITKTYRDNFEVIIDDKNDESGKIVTPFFLLEGTNIRKKLEVRFENSTYRKAEKKYKFWEYNTCDFNIYSNDIKKAIELAINRLIIIFKNGVPTVFNKYIVSGYKLDEKTNKKIPFEIEMENTELYKGGEKWITLKKGDTLEFDTANDDNYGFWYIVDNVTKKRLSNRLKGGSISKYFSDGKILKIK